MTLLTATRHWRCTAIAAAPPRGPPPSAQTPEPAPKAGQQMVARISGTNAVMGPGPQNDSDRAQQKANGELQQRGADAEPDLPATRRATGRLVQRLPPR